MYDATKTTYSSKTDMTFAMMSSRYAGAPGVTLMTPIYLHRQYSKWEMNRFIVIRICVIIRSRFNLLNSPFSRYYCHMLHQVLLVVPILLGLSKLLRQSRRPLPSLLSASISHLENGKSMLRKLQIHSSSNDIQTWGIQGCTKRTFPGCVNTRWKIAFSCPQKINKTQFFHPISHNFAHFRAALYW